MYCCTCVCPSTWPRSLSCWLVLLDSHRNRRFHAWAWVTWTHLTAMRHISPPKVARLPTQNTTHITPRLICSLYPYKFPFCWITIIDYPDNWNMICFDSSPCLYHINHQITRGKIYPSGNIRNSSAYPGNLSLMRTCLCSTRMFHESFLFFALLPLVWCLSRHILCHDQKRRDQNLLLPTMIDSKDR